MKGGPKNYAAGGAYQPKGTVTKAEHDALVAAKGRSFTEAWFKWLNAKVLPDDQRAAP